MPLTHVVRENEKYAYDPVFPYDESIFNVVSLSGEAYKNDTKLFHQIILRNINEGHNAFTYTKSLF